MGALTHGGDVERLRSVSEMLRGLGERARVAGEQGAARRRC